MENFKNSGQQAQAPLIVLNVNGQTVRVTMFVFVMFLLLIVLGTIF